MKAHWREVHDDASFSGTVPEVGAFARPTKLQTFFRGVKIRYFEVCVPDVARSESRESGDRGLRSEQPPSLGVTVEESTRGLGDSLPNIDLEAIRCFHYSITETASTLPAAASSSSSDSFWQKSFVDQALQDRRLMCGLLALSACHLAALADSPSIERELQRRGSRYSHAFYSCRNDDSDETGDEASKLRQQIESLLFTASISSNNTTTTAGKNISLESLISKIQDCVPLDVEDSQDKPSDTNHIEVDPSPTTRQDGPRTPTSTQPRTAGTDALITHLHALPSRLASILGRPDPNKVDEVLTILSAIIALIKSSKTDAPPIVPPSATSSPSPPAFHSLLGTQTHKHLAAKIIIAYWAAGPVQRATLEGWAWYWRGVAREVVERARRELLAREEREGQREGIAELVELVRVLEPFAR